MTDVSRELEKRCFDFAAAIVKLADALVRDRKEWILSRQIVKCGTSIGANYREAQYAQTKPDFIAKVNISLKEAGETSYWLDLLVATEHAPEDTVRPLKAECEILIASFVRILKTAKANPNR